MRAPGLLSRTSRQGFARRLVAPAGQDSSDLSTCRLCWLVLLDLLVNLWCAPLDLFCLVPPQHQLLLLLNACRAVSSIVPTIVPRVFRC